MDSEMLMDLDTLVISTLRETLVNEAKKLGFDVSLKEFDVSLTLEGVDLRFQGDKSDSTFGPM